MSDLSFQVRAPLGLELATGDVVGVAEWSLSGLQFPGDSDVLPSKGILSIPFQGVDIRFPVQFKPGAEGRELLFDGLTGRQRETLAVFYRSILSGRMASTEEVITSLDTPVDLVPMEETEEEKTVATQGKTPRSLRVVWNLLVYCLIGVVVFGLLGQQIWTRLSSIPVGQARVVAELVEHRAPTGAYVDEIRVAPGEAVRQGQTLVVLSSPGHGGTLTEIRTDLRRAEADARQSRKALALHMEGLADARRPFEAALAQAIAARRVGDFLGDHTLQDMRRAQQALALFDAEISQRADDFHARREYLQDMLRAQKDDIAQLKRELSAEKDVGGAADIVALADGIIAEIPAFEDQFLARGDVALTLEEAGPRRVIGWLDEGMAAAVYPGMVANLTAISGGETRQIRGVVEDVVAMANPDRAGSFGLRVSVLPADWVMRDAPELLRPDAPMELRLARNPAWLAALKELIDVRP
ncbi:HlyD family secretion protein [Dinoroseobacter sp. S124A]|uniref:HlyD family secretion protein n=1 Tax=Dinoroseobacter sp. S124A TaxID=3415128 RepID=UPI003C7C3960